MPIGHHAFIVVSLSVLFMFSTSSNADIAVIVNQNSPIDSATNKEISALFLAKTNRLNGSFLKTIDLLDSDTDRHLFYQQVSKKSAMQMKAYWSRLIFTGKGAPPLIVDSAEDVIDIIAEESDYIGYVNIEQIGESVKVLLTIP